MSTTQLLDLPCFAGLGHAERRLLERDVDVVHLPARHSLLTAPGVATELLLVVDGLVAALDEPSRRHGPGAVLGAGPLLTGTATGRGFRTVGPAVIGCVSRGQARRLMTGSPAFATAVAVSLAQELLLHA